MYFDLLFALAFGGSGGRNFITLGYESKSCGTLEPTLINDNQTYYKFTMNVLIKRVLVRVTIVICHFLYQFCTFRRPLRIANHLPEGQNGLFVNKRKKVQHLQ